MKITFNYKSDIHFFIICVVGAVVATFILQAISWFLPSLQNNTFLNILFYSSCVGGAAEILGKRKI